MKSARERALDIAWELIGKSMSRAMFAVAVDDDSMLGKSLRETVDIVERGIDKDRADIRKAQAPS